MQRVVSAVTAGDHVSTGGIADEIRRYTSSHNVTPEDRNKAGLVDPLSYWYNKRHAFPLLA